MKKSELIQLIKDIPDDGEIAIDTYASGTNTLVPVLERQFEFRFVVDEDCWVLC